MTLLGRPKRVLFHHLGKGRALLEPAAGQPSRELFDILAKAGILVETRAAWLTQSGEAAVCNTPAFLRAFKVRCGQYPGKRVVGRAAIFFDFGQEPGIESISLDDIVAIADKCDAAPSFEAAFRRSLPVQRSRTPDLLRKPRTENEERDTLEPGAKPVPFHVPRRR